ncbi:MAG: bifunctional D-glycero-beta-D-manno-heptose-7-phosphate kinase/D-glycero-beta-D-manno-heptose 1-phosphate adenylyltransferase HldE [Pseudomonadales bacterium]
MSDTAATSTAKPLSLPSLLGVRALVVGDVMLDRYWYGEAERVSQEAPVPVVDVGGTEDRPGGAANTALNIVSLGAPCTLVGFIGDDEAGAALETRLSAAGVHCELIRVPDWQTVVKLRVVSQQQQLLRADFETRLPESGLVEQLQAKVQAHLAEATVLVLQDYDKGAIAKPEALIAAASKSSVPVVVDPKHKPLSRYAGAQLLKPNIHEFTLAVGAPDNHADLVARGARLAAEQDYGALVVTQGGRGMTVISAAGELRHIPARPVDVFDVTGAGDTAAAALAVTLSLGWSAVDCAEVANVASGLAVSRAGTVAITGPELSVALRGRSVASAGVLSRGQLRTAVQRAKQAGEQVVFTNGCFDILHAGHVSYLEEAKALGHRLLVAVNDDASVTRLKGAGRPVNPLDRRLKVLAGLAAVDWVVGFAEDTPEALLTELQPQILVKGGDYGPEQVVGADLVRAYGGTVKVLGLVDDCSTTAIVNRIADSS